MGEQPNTITARSIFAEKMCVWPIPAEMCERGGWREGGRGGEREEEEGKGEEGA